MTELEDSLNGIESVIEAGKAHAEAQSREARDQLASGETHQVVIEDPPGVEGPDAVTRISGIITFVAPQDMDLTTGTTVRVKLVDVGESHARAVATEIIEE